MVFPLVSSCVGIRPIFRTARQPVFQVPLHLVIHVSSLCFLFFLLFLQVLVESSLLRLTNSFFELEQTSIALCISNSKYCTLSSCYFRSWQKISPLFHTPRLFVIQFGHFRAYPLEITSKAFPFSLATTVSSDSYSAFQTSCHDRCSSLL